MERIWYVYTPFLSEEVHLRSGRVDWMHRFPGSGAKKEC